MNETIVDEELIGTQFSLEQEEEEEEKDEVFHEYQNALDDFFLFCIFFSTIFGGLKNVGLFCAKVANFILSGFEPRKLP
jgi:hypothetical protein